MSFFRLSSTFFTFHEGLGLPFLYHKLNSSDVNRATNMMRLGEKVINVLRKPLSFLFSSNGVISIKRDDVKNLSGTSTF
ncbi:hypothetical protein [Sulfolobus sp. B1]|uniref:hypothetical protein n=1 Tax=Sulfolobus sp. B1 TaxID=2200888 RepID=UPI00117E5A29|nr:hypothetical protein [Sulfolobus sp. B1]